MRSITYIYIIIQAKLYIVKIHLIEYLIKCSYEVKKEEDQYQLLLKIIRF